VALIEFASSSLPVKVHQEKNRNQKKDGAEYMEWIKFPATLLICHIGEF
jgi:hypothetical protein